MHIKERTEIFQGLEIAALSFAYRGKWENSQVTGVFAVRAKGYPLNRQYLDMCSQKEDINEDSNEDMPIQWRSATPMHFTSSYPHNEHCSPSLCSLPFSHQDIQELSGFNYTYPLGPHRPFCSLEKFPTGSWISLSWPRSSSLGQSSS